MPVHTSPADADILSVMPASSCYTVVYDLSDDRERYRVDKVLKGWGFRVQKSVFECRLSRRERIRLAGLLEGLQLKSGTVRIYRVLGEGAIRIGAITEEDVGRAVVFVF